MTYEEAISYIHHTLWLGSKPGLDRITELLNKLGNPEKSLRCIHVAGTNGKGSFCAMLDSVLRTAGYRVGLFTSPFIEFFEERIVIDGKPINKEELAELTEITAKQADTMRDPPTEFELITAIGFLAFMRHRPDFCIIECGMGGRLDSTNVIASPCLSVITGIALDHTAYLGDTVEAIAGEKAGIIKRGCPVLFGGTPRSVSGIIRERAATLDAPFFETEDTAITVRRHTPDGISFVYRDSHPFSLSLLGSYQAKNAANVIEAVSVLRRYGVSISDEALFRGLYLTKWKGRFERLHTNPDCFFDGGHNPEGVAAAALSVRNHFGSQKIIVITGVLADKDYRKMAKSIADIAYFVRTVTPDNPRALPAEDYAACFREIGVPAIPSSDYREAMQAALREAEKTGAPILCLGSLYVYGDCKAALSTLTDERKTDTREKS